MSLLKKLTLLFLGWMLLTGLANAAEQNWIEGSDNRIEENRELPPFEQLRIEGSFEIHILCGPNRTFKITGDDNILPLIRSDVQDGQLHIFANRSYATREPLRIDLTVERLQAAHLSGANATVIAGLHGENFSLFAEGAGETTLAGKLEQLQLELAGSATVAGDKLLAKSVDIMIQGVGDAKVHALRELSTTINGVGQVNYLGSPPLINRTINGVGSVRPAN